MAHVLLVDDTKSVLGFYKAAMESLGHTSVGACDGQKALEAFHKGHFDLIVTDYQMPEMTGIELATIIRNQGFDIPIIMITASQILPEESSVVNEVLAKPPSYDLICQTVRRFLEPKV